MTTVQALVLLLAGAAQPMAGKVPTRTDHEVVIIGVSTKSSKPLIDVHGATLRIREVAEFLDDRSGYTAEGRVFPMDRSEVERRYAELSVMKQLSVQEGALYFDGRRVTLPADVAMRSAWQAILWKGWVICIGRTSKTDKEAQMMPPFIAAELITFNAKALNAAILYLVPVAPSRENLQLHVLRPMAHSNHPRRRTEPTTE